MLSTHSPLVSKPNRFAELMTLDKESIIKRVWLLLLLATLLTCLVFPLYSLLVHSVEDKSGQFIGLQNFVSYLSNPALTYSITNTLYLGFIATVIVIALAFTTAWCFTRSNMPGKTLFKGIAYIPLLTPSLLSAISLIYWFGNQGVLKEFWPFESIYGVSGIVFGISFWAFPHALIILTTALKQQDARLYEASEVLGASPIKTFFTVTLPGCKYGLISATAVVFTLVVTDFGVAKVIGGQYNVLATDIYKQVIGQQNFSMGAVVSIMLLIPALITFIVDQWVQRKQQTMFDSKSVTYQPHSSSYRDGFAFLYCTLLSVIILAIIGMAGYSSLVTFWPYDLSLSFNNYQFNMMDGGGWGAYQNSLIMATGTMILGTAFIFLSAYACQKIEVWPIVRKAIHMLSVIPAAVPGLVLGLSYIFFFNQVNNPLNVIYGTFVILMISSVVHFLTVGHLTMVTAFKQLPGEIESVSESLKVPFYVTLGRVTLPMTIPAILEVGIYLFVNAMTTVSAVVFLYSVDTMLASVAVLNMDDAGDTAPAAAMAMLIFVSALGVKLLYSLISQVIISKTQTWRTK
ncbi:putative 2-aminoethylphosphonate ABC transporter permease subunit [Litoribrevibacter albus]|uniref:ABC transporter permease n=1 Tax=Litoribrevibacter albus TaxID=1473156 RepID=A0AA37S8V6_9GAMM|nr:putative 2-aminoethylphosphonate ABC transporter permease subunit [Litoribrevibacter albus]GLQ30713.1 ABC transporter permease [Litoribrevibacter albus]